MTKFLHFSSSGFDFLMDVEEILEVYDQASSQKKISDLLHENNGCYTWRSGAAHVLNLDAYLGFQANGENCCIVCPSTEDDFSSVVICVEKIYSLIDGGDLALESLQVSEKKLRQIVKAIAVDQQENQNMFMLLNKNEIELISTTH